MIRVLIACEFSGVVRSAFEKEGYYAMSADLLPTDIPGEHYQGDVRDILNQQWDLMIAHPPCTYLANSGVQFISGKKQKEGRYEQMIEGAKFFKELLNYTAIPFRAIENPIMHKYAIEIIGRRQNQCIQPWQFGHGERKATCLWLENLPVLLPTNIVEGRVQKNRWIAPSKNRWKLRSITYTGIAEAMAKQWGTYVSDNR